MSPREYCQDCAVPAIRAYLAGLQAEQGLNTAQHNQMPDKDSSGAIILTKIIQTRLELIRIKMEQLEIASAGCCLEPSHPHTE